MPTEEEMKAQRARFLNEEIEDLYGIRIIQCGQCSHIISILAHHKGDIICRDCGNVDEECHFPDLFY